MILQITRPQIEQPKISLNQLGEFPFSSERKKLAILRNSKYGNSFCAPYYASASNGILRSLKDGEFSPELLREAVDKINGLEAEKAYQVIRRENNVKAVESFLNLGEVANPPHGIHRVIHHNARIRLGGVIVSARPEIITENNETQDFAFTKLRLSKSKVSADAQEIVLRVLKHYGQQQAHGGLEFSMEKSRLIDCFSKTIIAGHAVGRHRDQQLHQALYEICVLWPQVKESTDFKPVQKEGVVSVLDAPSHHHEIDCQLY
jgi:hypothetical protein